MSVKEIEFPSYEGSLTLRGRAWVPEEPADQVPVIVASHGLGDSADRLTVVAEWFAGNGFGVVLYDHRNFGPSDGEPRNEADPVAQYRDMQMAITFAQAQPEFDANRVGLWGTSFSGGHVLAVAGLDKRVKAVVAQTPWISGPLIGANIFDSGTIGAFREAFNEERRKTLRGERPTLAKQVLMPGDPPGTFALVDTEEGYNYAVNGPAGIPMLWQNAFTLRSLELAIEFDVRLYASRISPTPVLLILAGADRIIPADMARAFLAEVDGPKDLVEIAGREHHSLYVPGHGFEEAAEASTAWFAKYL